MNKYQEAFKYFVSSLHESEHESEDIKALRELCDKATPKKPLLSINGLYGCKRCKHIVESVQNYCEHCGQAIDWSDE